ncbi:MAG: hypothetical protein U5L11_03585 [Arhodomonas sp.]|nr:hypothetical protein [Arhodomonas sp.]
MEGVTVAFVVSLATGLIVRAPATLAASADDWISTSAALFFGVVLAGGTLLHTGYYLHLLAGSTVPGTLDQLLDYSSAPSRSQRPPPPPYSSLGRTVAAFASRVCPVVGWCFAIGLDGGGRKAFRFPCAAGVRRFERLGPGADVGGADA